MKNKKSYGQKLPNLIRNEVRKSCIIYHFKCIFMQKRQHFLRLVFVGHTFLSDSELEWTPLMFELPNAPAYEKKLRECKEEIDGKKDGGKREREVETTRNNGKRRTKE